MCVYVQCAYLSNSLSRKSSHMYDIINTPSLLAVILMLLLLTMAIMNKLLIRNKHISLLQGARVFIVQSRQLVPHYEGVATGTCRKHSSTNGTRFLWSHFNLIPSHQDTAEKSPR